MNSKKFFNDALVLLGHGSTKNADSDSSVLLHASELRRRKIFAEVQAAFWKQDPHIKKVLAVLTAPRIFIVPMFVSDGYFSDEIIPRELGFQASRITYHASQARYYCGAIGTHDSMTNVILARACDVVAQFPFPRQPRQHETTLIIAGHGTEKNSDSRKPIERQVELIRAMNLFADVHAVFMEEEPRIGACLDLAETRNIVVVPFFISDGLHVQEDIPVMLGEPESIVKQRMKAGRPTWRNPTEKKGKLIWYSKSIGSDPHIAEVILERVREACTPQSEEVKLENSKIKKD